MKGTWPLCKGLRIQLLLWSAVALCSSCKEYRISKTRMDEQLAKAGEKGRYGAYDAPGNRTIHHLDVGLETSR
jgi:hypothetical protein